MNKALIRKYNVAGPRYTSYPAVPMWSKTPPTPYEWKNEVKKTFDVSNSKHGISIYVHLPYCESLCTYCGCTTRITVNHAVEEPYIEAVLKEWKLYLDVFKETPIIAELHLGGGTPTFFSPHNLRKLIEGFKSTAQFAHNAELGFEGHPNNTSEDHLRTLYDLGFRRISLGIQDFDPVVQNIINRVQSFETVHTVTDLARKIGFTSVNYDLIYGLPKQTINSINDTLDKVARLKPDRIAFYSYAHVPWVKKGQRMFTSEDLPDFEEKRALYELGKERLEEIGYHEIGMDHFALESDELFDSYINNKMHRNFMGYTPRHTSLVIGLGVSAISDTWEAYGQNIKTVEEYKKSIEQGKFPVFKGHLLSEDELITRHQINNLMCQFQTKWDDDDKRSIDFNKATERLKELEMDGLIEIHSNSIKVLSSGRPFVRNVCMVLDHKLWEQNDENQIFSKVV